MSNLATRTLTGIIFVIVVTGAVYWNPYATGFLFLLFALVGYYEFIMMGGSIIPSKHVTGYLTGIFSYIMIFLAGRSLLDPLALLSCAALLLIHFFIARSFVSAKEPYRLRSFYGVLYVFIPFAIINLLNNPEFTQGEFRPAILLGFMALVWINDIFAYITGKYLGKHKLFKKISPKKTWEGALGGLAFTVAAGYLASQWIMIPGNAEWPVIAILVVVSGVAGDLFESSMKRKAGIKDSGRILPGHGGVLDRFDAMIFSGPVVFFYVLLGLL